MAPHGLTISKLGIQVTADDEVARNLICLKISLPRESEAKQAVRWGLFSNETPLLTSNPQIHSLPLSTNTNHSDQLFTAALLLSLPTESSIQRDRNGAGPSIEVHPTSRQVYVSLNQGSKRRRDSMSAVGGASPGGSAGGRREFLVLMECEQVVDHIGGWSKLNVPLPKCLDNVIRFQILPPSSGSSTCTGEVSIVTDPKILPVPASTFSPRSISRSGSPFKDKAVQEDGWLDGEWLGPEDCSESESGDEAARSWLEGRFQSTDQLHLDWSFASTSPSLPALNVIPNWDARHPSIRVKYETTHPISSLLPIEAIIPDGWGWSELSIQSDNLVEWYSADGEWWDTLLSFSSPQTDPDESSTTDMPEDSFSTIRARRHNIATRLSQTSSGASLMRHPLPQTGPSCDEFSFELGHAASTPLTPRSSRGGSVLGQTEPREGPPELVLARPAPARYFELTFIESTEEANIRITGILIPLSRTLLVSPSVPVVIPFFRLPESDDRCQLVSPTPGSGLQVIDLSKPPTSNWADDRSHLRLPIDGSIKGEIQVKLKKSGSGPQMTLSFPWPKRSPEIMLTIPRPERSDTAVRVVKATMQGRSLPRAVVNTEKGTDVHIGRGQSGIGMEGDCVVVIQLEDEVILPLFNGAEGKMRVELVGPGWEGRIRTNLTRLSPKSYSLPLPCASTPYLTLSPQHPPRFAFAFSWSTLLNLFLLYLLVSLAQQVQRLRTEVTFIAEEARDLRMYNSKVEEMERRGKYEWERAEHDFVPHQEGGLEYTSVFSPDHLEVGSQDRSATAGKARRSSEEATSLGRLVMGQSGWDRWMISLSRSLGWLWYTVVWLVHA